MSSPEAQDGSRSGSTRGSDRETGSSDPQLEESNASQARIAPRRPAAGDPYLDPRPGGDASKAPTSLSPRDPDPIDTSSGVAWDDPDEL